MNLGCGGTLNGPSGSLTSPSYPSPYHHNAECAWTIRTSKGSKINFVFLDLDLETSNECNYDFVRIYDGPDRRSRVIGQYCHSMQQPIISTGNTLLVVFRSDYSQGGRGFHARYFMDCHNRINGLSGVIESPNFPDLYPHNRNCTWTIEAPLGNKINASFSHFDIEDPHVRYVLRKYFYFIFYYRDQTESRYSLHSRKVLYFRNTFNLALPSKFLNSSSLILFPSSKSSSSSSFSTFLRELVFLPHFDGSQDTELPSKQ